MPWFAKVAFIVALIIGGGYAACEIAYPTLFVRYKLTVNIEDNGVIRTGSGVVEIQYDIYPDFTLGDQVYETRGSLRGAAITVDLGQDGIVFVLNRWNTHYNPWKNPIPPGLKKSRGLPNLASLPFYVYDLPGPAPPSVIKRAVLELHGKPHTPIDVPAVAMPVMVRFRYIDRPESIQELFPTSLEEQLRHGAHFVSASFELTDDPIAETPAIWPDWLKHGNQKTLVFSFQNRPVPDPNEDIVGLRIADFKGP